MSNEHDQDHYRDDDRNYNNGQPAFVTWIGDAIKNYGFPILVACYLLWQQQLTTKFLQDKVEMHDVEVIKALKDNTRVIEKNTEVIQMILGARTMDLD